MRRDFKPLAVGWTVFGLAGLLAAGWCVCVCVCSDLHMCVFEHSRLFGVAGLVRDGFVPAAAWFGWVEVG